ncbi:DUF4115 domain-containing protein, partial [Lactobacillus sp. XV13L]|nr:DUF4115 domain-containing protein [Lactobacillus sp. XV13L]
STPTKKKTVSKKKHSKTKQTAPVKKQLQIEADTNKTDTYSISNWTVDSSHTLKLTATNADAWITVQSGNQGQSLWQGLINAGADHEVEVPTDVQQLQIRTGNAAATHIQINDVAVPLPAHPAGTVHTYTLLIK